MSGDAAWRKATNPVPNVTNTYVKSYVKNGIRGEKQTGPWQKPTSIVLKAK